MLKKANLLVIFFISNLIFWPFYSQILNFHFRFHLLIIFISYFLFLTKKPLTNSNSLKMTAFITIVLLLSCLISFLGPCTNYFEKLLFSIPLILMSFFVASEIGINSKNSDWQKLEAISLFVVFFLALTLFFEFFYPEKFQDHLGNQIGKRFSGFYDEPSHLGISALPPLLILISSKKNMATGLIFSLIIIFFSPSSSLIVGLIIGILFIAIFIQKKKYFLVYSLILLALNIVTLNQNQKAAVKEKIVTFLAPPKVLNTSNLVYMGGFADAKENFLRTNGLGIGFNMMGCAPLPKTSIRLENIVLESLNSKDGSNLLFKGISELGVIFFIALWIVFKNLYYAIEKNNQKPSRALQIKICILVSCIICITIRSTGWFDWILPMLIVTTISLNKSRNYSSRTNRRSISIISEKSGA